MSPILKAFADVDRAVPKRHAGHSGEVQAAPKIRIHRHLTTESRQSEIDADIWRDGRETLDAAGLLQRARFLAFTWDTRFEPALFQNR